MASSRKPPSSSTQTSPCLQCGRPGFKVRYCALPVALPSSMACLVPVPFAPPAGEEIEGQEAPVLPPQSLPLQVEKRGHSERLTARKRQNRVFWRLHRTRSQEAWLLPATRWHRS